MTVLQSVNAPMMPARWQSVMAKMTLTQGKQPLMLTQYEDAITVTDTYHETKSRFAWIGEIENERLLAALESLSELDLKILTLYAYAGYTVTEISKVPWNPKGLRFISESSELLCF